MDLAPPRDPSCESPCAIVQTAFRFEQPAHVPYWIPMEPNVAEGLDAHFGDASWRERFEQHLHAWHVGYALTDLGDGTQRDAFGTRTETGNISHIVEPALAEPSLAGYIWPEADALEDWPALGRLCEAETRAYRLCGLGFGLFERAWNMRGMENLMMDMYATPAFVDDLLDGIMAIHLLGIDRVAEHVPAEAVFGGDDWCDQRGPMMGVDLWRRFIKPRLARLIERAHARGRPYICHSCGNLLPLIDDLLEIGLDGLESLQPEAMDVCELKRRTYGRMVLIGGLGVQSTLPRGTPDEVRRETRRLMRELGRGGGYVLAPAKPIMEDVPAPNVAALIETVGAPRHA